MTGKLHHKICALVAGLLIHAALIASLPLVWCFGSNSVHAAERLDRASDRTEALRSSGQPSVENIEAAVLPAAKVPLQPRCPMCSVHHYLVHVAPFAAQPTPDNEKFATVPPKSGGPLLRSPPLIGRVTGVVSTNVSAQLEQLRTVVLLI